ncbi:LysR family transcriptional regulator [Aestuariibacter salexigens]|uniref:LysR family transcriptional regulator n=1 Tax=Aestuariibacter salexigens TaxID=226010 RepID=UPI0004189B49|nr:LysR family transcriptional regulator [Aestuariibacter salexigens]
MNNLTFRLLEVFQHVADCGSVTAASEQLSLSQPTVSLQLKKLNTMCGLPLLETHQGQLHMTEAGRAVYRCAQDVLNAQAKLTSHIQALKGVEVGSLRLAVVTTAKYIIPPLLADFCKAHPGIDVHLKVGNRAQIIERLQQNRDDIYIFSHPPEALKVDVQRFMPNRLHVIASADYRGPDNCRLEDIIEYKFLLREPGSGTRLAVDEFCERHDIHMHNTMLIESNEAIKLAVASGLGLAILSEYTLAQSPDPRVKILHIDGFPLRSYWHAVTLSNRPLSLASQSFAKHLADYGKQFHLED